jgi:hypothetical protein
MVLCSWAHIMSYIAELQAGHWLILAGCVSILAGAIGVSMTKSG